MWQMPVFSPKNINSSFKFQRAPVEDRYGAMKNKIGELMIKRKRNSLHDYQTLVLIDGIRQNLPKEMIVEVDKRLQKASDNVGWSR